MPLLESLRHFRRLVAWRRRFCKCHDRLHPPNVLNFTAATSRQIFAFARDDGFPFRKWITKVNHGSGSPRNALTVCVFFVILIAFIVLGSSVAFQAIISLGTLALAFKYELSILCLVWRLLKGARLPPYAWSLGRAGFPINIAGSLYSFYLMFFAVIPPEYPVTEANFNWSLVMFTAVMAFATVYYVLAARKVYKGPRCGLLPDVDLRIHLPFPGWSRIPAVTRIHRQKTTEIAVALPATKP